jgi:hypothetical protein
MRLRGRLAEHHLSDESRDTVKLALGLMGTLAALLLGLLVSSAEESFDAKRGQVNELAATIATLDRVLGLYGDEAAAARAELRGLIEGAIAQVWPTHSGARSNLSFDQQRGEAFFRSIQSLQPPDALKGDLKQTATDLSLQLIRERSMIVALAADGVSVPVLTLVVVWLVLILFGFSLLAPRNAVAVAALIISAAAISGAVLLLLELYRPFEGLVQISSGPLLTALGRPAG